MVTGRKKIAKIGSEIRNALLCKYVLLRSDGLWSKLMSLKWMRTLQLHIPPHFWSFQRVKIYGIWYDLVTSLVTHKSTHFSNTFCVKCYWPSMFRKNVCLHLFSFHPSISPMNYNINADCEDECLCNCQREWMWLHQKWFDCYNEVLRLPSPCLEINHVDVGMFDTLCLISHLLTYSRCYIIRATEEHRHIKYNTSCACARFLQLANHPNF